jgi:ABC-type lipoprotein release transport system permease subunit
MLILRLALRNILRNKRRTSLTCLLLVSALVIMILMDGLMMGVTRIMVESLTETLEGEAQIYRQGWRDRFDPALYLDQPDEIRSSLDADDSVVAWSERVMTPAVLASSYSTQGVMVYGVNMDQERKVSRIQQAQVSGDGLEGPGDILLGDALADKLEVTLGDRIVLTTSSLDGNDLVQVLFRVRGLIRFGPSELDERLAFIDLVAARQMLGLGDGSHQFVVRFEDASIPNASLVPLFEQVRSEVVGAEGWLSIQPAIGSMLEMSNFGRIVLGLILFLLAALGVVNSIFMSIYERLYEFAVTKAIGTRPFWIGRLIMLESFLMAFISVAIGLVIAYFLGGYLESEGLNMGQMEVSGVVIPDRIKPQMAFNQFVEAASFLILLTMLTALYPALYAAKITPAEAVKRSL